MPGEGDSLGYQAYNLVETHRQTYQVLDALFLARAIRPPRARPRSQLECSGWGGGGAAREARGAFDPERGVGVHGTLAAGPPPYAPDIRGRSNRGNRLTIAGAASFRKRNVLFVCKNKAATG